MSSTETPDVSMGYGSYRARAGAQSIKDAVRKMVARFPDGGMNAPPGPILGAPIEDESAQLQSRAAALRLDHPVEPDIGKVGILGAGAAGLYAAIILESIGIECEILESSCRPGGRLHTHYFDEEKNPKKYQYYDVGAMRYPLIPIMHRTFDLFHRVNFTEENGKLIKYWMTAEESNTPLLYNNIRWDGKDPHGPQGDYFAVGTDNGGSVPQNYVDKGVDSLLDDAFLPYKSALAANWHQGWAALMRNDHLSTRTFMSQNQMIVPRVDISGNVKVQTEEGLDYPFDVIQWCENMNSATGLYEEAFSESVMDSLDFGWPSAARQGGITRIDEAAARWLCIDGGGSTLVTAMLEKLKKTKIHYNSRVTAITGVRAKYTRAVTTSVIVTTTSTPTISTGGGRATPEPTVRHQYDRVLSSLPFGVLGQVVDISKAGFDYQQVNAIRALHYDCSVKVGIRFKKQWWRLLSYNITGGTSSTDRPIRTCVYPSYGLQTDPETPGVLMVSYTWAQDATRIGALVQGSDFKTRKYPEERELIDLLFRDLANLHGANEKDLRELYMDHYAHNWFEDPNANGAFALFGAGQFSNMYPSISRPAAYNDRLNLIGEATSVHHAWVVGALSSAWRGIYDMLKAAGCKETDSRIIRLKKSPWRPDGTYDESCWGPVPEEVQLVVQVPLKRPPGVGAPRGPGGVPTDDFYIPPPAGGRGWWDHFTPARQQEEE